MNGAVRYYFWIFVFAVAMGFLESAVVVYIRAIYYPEGFAFPLKEMSHALAVTELFRELATMVMLAGVAALASKRFTVAVAWFIYAFAIWDIFYYIFLYLLTGWPPSLLTWDILFLLPVMWVGPVLAPVINALTMILLAAVIVEASGKHRVIRLKAMEWILLIAGSLVTIIGYTSDYMHFMLNKFSFLRLITLSDYSAIFRHSAGYVPVRFDWWIFIVGEVLFFIAIGWFCKRHFFLKTKEAGPG